MSVIMTLQFAGDAKALEQYAGSHADTMKGIVEAARRHGLIAHRFYGSEDGSSVLVADEWPDRQSFEAFFQEQMDTIMPIMAAAGVSAPVEPSIWRELSTHDAYGWGA